MRLVDRLVALAFALADLGVVVAPALVLALAARKGGVTENHGLDLLVASAVVGGIHAVVTYRRTVDAERVAIRRRDVWLAAIDSLVVLALTATLLLIVVLGGFADQHAVLVNRGWPVVALWVGVQLVAVSLAEVTGRLVFRWLEAAPHPRRGPAPARERAGDDRGRASAWPSISTTTRR